MATKEELLKAKIPCAETGIEIRHSLCDICSPTSHCGVNCYVKDGVIIKVEGDENHPLNQGLLCTKGGIQPAICLPGGPHQDAPEADRSPGQRAVRAHHLGRGLGYHREESPGI